MIHYDQNLLLQRQLTAMRCSPYLFHHHQDKEFVYWGRAFAPGCSGLTRFLTETMQLTIGIVNHWVVVCYSPETQLCIRIKLWSKERPAKNRGERTTT